MALIDFLKRSMGKDEDFKQAEKNIKIQTILEQRQKNANERELEKFFEEKRQEQIKTKLNQFREEQKKDFMKTTILNKGNMFANSDNIFKGKGKILEVKGATKQKGLFFK